MPEPEPSASEYRDQMVRVRGLSLRVREWAPERSQADAAPFVLLHGLASNARTWDATARALAAAGHPVFAVDQRGHGLSDKPDAGYDFAEVTADLRALIDALDLDHPILAGQSWGGNVVLDFAARYPDVPAGVVLVDGGYLEMQSNPDATWDRISVDLRPPALAGMPRADLAARIRRGHPDWTDAGVEATLGNFETLPDGTIRPWLTLDHHMAILRALFEHRPSALYSRIAAPVLIAAAESGDPTRFAQKRASVARAAASLPRCRVRWFAGADHDIHVQRPAELADFILDAVASGFLGAPDGSCRGGSRREGA